VFTGLIPFYSYRYNPAVIKGVMSGERPERPSEATELGLADDLWELIQSAWAEDVSRRPSVPTIIDFLLQVMTLGHRDFYCFPTLTLSSVTCPVSSLPL